MDRREAGRKRRRVQLGPPSHGFVAYIKMDRGHFVLEEEDIVGGRSTTISLSEHEAFNLLDYLKEELPIE